MTDFEVQVLQIMKADFLLGLGNLVLEILKYVNP